MMSEELKAVVNKPKEEQTEEDKKLIKEAIAAFQKATRELSVEHGLVHQAVLKITPNGILPAFEIIVHEPTETNP